MVDNKPHRILVSGACVIKKGSRGRELIVNGPVYDLAQAQAMLKQHGLRVVNDDALDDQASFQPQMSDQELTAFILALSKEDYEGSERSSTSIRMTVDADSYAMKWNRNRCVRWEHGAKLYVKFGFSNVNPTCLVVSIHPANW